MTDVGGQPPTLRGAMASQGSQMTDDRPRKTSEKNPHAHFVSPQRTLRK
jgi:hypothetical protein